MNYCPNCGTSLTYVSNGCTCACHSGDFDLHGSKPCQCGLWPYRPPVKIEADPDLMFTDEPRFSNYFYVLTVVLLILIGIVSLFTTR